LRVWTGGEGAAALAGRAVCGAARAAAVLGESLLEQGKAPEAEKRLLEVGQGLQSASISDPIALARVYFLWGESVFKQFQAVGPAEIERKANALQVLQQAYTSAAQMGGDWAIAGMYRLGQALLELAKALETMPEPPGLSAAESAQLKATLQQQAKELKAGADEALDACVKKARELEVYTPFALGCVTRQDVDPRLPVPPAQPALDGARLKGFRDALAKNASDVEALEGLGRAYLDAGDLRRARLVFGRMVEVDENRAVGHSSLGHILVRMGELELGKQALQRALELDARDDVARANLAALKCRYGDPDGAKADLAKLKSSPSGPGVDADWARCRK